MKYIQHAHLSSAGHTTTKWLAGHCDSLLLPHMTNTHCLSLARKTATLQFQRTVSTDCASLPHHRKAEKSHADLCTLGAVCADNPWDVNM